jgi:uncharacterized protein (TIGR03437 family)
MRNSSGTFRGLLVSSALVAYLTGWTEPTYSAPSRIASVGFPFSFEANVGQADSQVKFLSRGADHLVLLSPTRAVFKFQGRKSAAALAMTLVGANPFPEIEGRDPLPARSNYFHGKDPRQWHTGVPHYGQVQYRQVYPGVDLIYHGGPGQLEYDFVISPGADPRAIQLAFQGVKKMRLDSAGNLVLETATGDIRQHRPAVYQDTGGVRRRIAGRYVWRGSRHVGLEVGGYDHTLPLVIDPVLGFSTFLSPADPKGIAVDSAGNVYVAGTETGSVLPTVNPFQGSSKGGLDAFVAKFNSTGTALIYSTYLGGSEQDQGYALAVDAAGNAYVTGTTYSPDFPTVNAFQSTKASQGSRTAFVTKLNPAGSALVYSTYLGGSSFDEAYGIAVDRVGNAVVVGVTGSDDFPSVGTSLPPGQGGAFVAKFNATGAGLVYSFAAGGPNNYANAVAVDSAGNAYVVGYGNQLFPSVNAIQPLPTGSNAVVMKLDLAGAIVWSTFLGGSATDNANGVAVDDAGSVYVAGETSSTDFPVRNAFQPKFGGVSDAFVAKINAAGTVLDYSTYLGGNSEDRALAVAVDPEGNAHITGETASSNFPTVNPLQASRAAAGSVTDAFVATLNPQGSALRFSTYLGSSGGDASGGAAIAVETCGNSYVAGYAGTGFRTTPGVFRPTTQQGGTAFAAKIDFSTDAPFITSVATSSGGPNIAQNSWIEVHGSNLATPPGRIWGGSDFSGGTMPTALDQVSVTVNNKPAFVYYVSCNQVNVLTPLDSSAGPVPVQLKNKIGASNTLMVTMQNVSPALILAGGTHYVVAQHANGSLVGPASLSQPGYTFTPAHVGETVVLYGFGFGLPTGPLTNGAVTQTGSLASLPAVSINANPAQVQFAGVISPGLYQLNIVIPAGTMNGDNPIIVSYSGSSIPAGALITVSP